MENTNTIEFPNDQAEWFIAFGESFKGPFKASEVYQKIQEKEVSWIDYCYREKEGQWIRIADQPVFKVLQPEPPKPKPVMAPPPPPKKVEEDIKWFLFQSDAQTGPYAASELQRLASAGQIQESAFVWQEKFTDWKPFAEVSELKAPAAAPVPGMPSAPKLTTAAPAAAAAKKDNRHAPRKPLVAQIYMTNESDLVTGMCRDISIGGMQVLTDEVPGEIGTKIRLHVEPPKDTGLKAFVAEGTIVRILEDRRGFSFRFSKISDEAKKSIESYIA